MIQIITICEFLEENDSQGFLMSIASQGDDLMMYETIGGSK